MFNISDKEIEEAKLTQKDKKAKNDKAKNQIANEKRKNSPLFSTKPIEDE
jgi:hypothetical protein